MLTLKEEAGAKAPADAEAKPAVAAEPQRQEPNKADGSVAIRVPDGIGSVSAAGMEFKATDGVVRVPPGLEALVREHFASLTRAADREAAKAKALIEKAMKEAAMLPDVRELRAELKKKGLI